MDQFATPFVSARLAETPTYEYTIRYEPGDPPEKGYAFDYYVVITLENGEEWEHAHQFRSCRDRDGVEVSGAQEFLARVKSYGVVYLNHWRPVEDRWAYYRGPDPDEERRRY